MSPPPTFLYTKSYLLQEEHRIRHSLQMEAQTALLAGTTNPTAPKPVAPAPSPSSGSNHGANDRRKKRKASDGRNRQNNAASQGVPPGGQNMHPGAAPPPWASAYNPWHGVVQAWPMNAWRPSILGSRPGVSPPQAMAALSAPTPTMDSNYYSSASSSLPTGLYSALNGMSIQNSGGCGGDWFLNTGATAHMASNPGILTSPQSPTIHRHIIVGNGQLLPPQSTGHTKIPTLLLPSNYAMF